MNRIITVPELLKLKDSDKDLIIFDCRFDLMDKAYGLRSYKEGHIDGAIALSVETELADKVCEHGGRHPFKEINSLVDILEKKGVRDDSIVVAYDDGDMQGSARLIFQLNNIGFYNAYALDGGLIAYKSMGGKIETGDGENNNLKSSKSGSLNVKIDNSFIVDHEYVKSKLYDENTILVDSRSHPRYLGLEEPVDRIAGHIPSAKSYFFVDVVDLDNLASGTYKSDDFLKEHFKDLDPNKEIILYCGSGISLMVNALALDKIKIPYKIYPGSYSDWVSYEDCKVETIEE